MDIPPTRRGSLAINPLLLTLMVVLAAVFAWRGYVLLDILSSAGPTAYTSGKRMGVMLACILGPLLCCAVAGGVAAACYFMFGRSESAGVNGAAVTLLAAIGFFGYSTYTASTQPRPAPTATTNGATSLLKQTQESAERQRQALQQQMEKARDLAQQRPGIAPSSQQRPATQGSPLPESQANPDTAENGASRARPSPPVTPAENAVDANIAAKVAAALDPLRLKTQQKVDAFIQAADPMIEALAKAPRPLKSDLEQRVRVNQTLKQEAAELEAWFRGLDAQAEAALNATGLDAGVQIREGMNFSRAMDSFGKANACRSLGRLFDAGMAEGQALQNAAGKWRVDATGTVTTSDRSLEFRLRNLRESVQRELRDVATDRAILARH